MHRDPPSLAPAMISALVTSECPVRQTAVSNTRGPLAGGTAVGLIALRGAPHRPCRPRTAARRSGRWWRGSLPREPAAAARPPRGPAAPRCTVARSLTHRRGFERHHTQWETISDPPCAAGGSKLRLARSRWPEEGPPLGVCSRSGRKAETAARSPSQTPVRSRVSARIFRVSLSSRPNRSFSPCVEVVVVGE